MEEQTNCKANATPMNRQFWRFVADLAAITDGSTRLQLGQRSVNCTILKDANGQVLAIQLEDGTIYNLRDNRRNRCTAAAAGLLGERFVQQGKDGLGTCEEMSSQDVDHKAAKQRKGRARAAVEQLWGTWADRIWALNWDCAKRPVIAQATRALLEAGVKDIPNDLEEARRMARMPQINHAVDWPQVKRLMEALLTE